MAANGWSPRIAMYSHDTYGLGHLTRTTRIARRLVAALPGSSVLILSGSPIAHRFSFPQGVDYIKIPSVVKAGPEYYVARELGISNRRIRRMRAQLIHDAVEQFRPHLLLVDNVPLGMRGELWPTLRRLRQHHPATRIHLNLRDVLDDPRPILSTWRQMEIPHILDAYYDAIHVFGCRDLFDAVAAYGLPPEKTRHLGYIRAEADETQPPQAPPPPDPDRHTVLVTIGGGGDGDDIVRVVLELQAALGRRSPFQFRIVSGPLMDGGKRQELAARCTDLPGVSLHTYVEGLPGWMASSDLVLAMGGYNTLCEILSTAQRAVIVPRAHPRQEQLLRARLFERQKWVRVVDPRELSPQTLSAALDQALSDAPARLHEAQTRLTGLDELARELEPLLRKPANGTARTSKRPRPAARPERGSRPPAAPPHPEVRRSIAPAPAARPTGPTLAPDRGATRGSSLRSRPL